MSRARVVVLGILGRMPFAGIAWQVAHYVEGLRRAGCEVHYLEDTGDWPYDLERNEITADPASALRTLSEVLDALGLEGRWAYRAASDERPLHGLSEAQLDRVLEHADALVNLSGATRLRDEHRRVPVRIHLETDPVRPQIQVAQRHAETIERLEAHTHHFSFGESLGRPECGVPVERFHYQPTRQPVVVEWWEARAAAFPLAGAPAPSDSGRFTTVANWRQTGSDVEWKGERYRWSKHSEFLKLLDLPRRTSETLELALSSIDDDTRELLRAHGWQLADALALSRDPATYRGYLIASRAELTVAKDQNVRLSSGWFSDRSACYLAAGRPVVTQDTGFRRHLPTGIGLYTFRSADEALGALESIAADYPGNRRAAREIAHDCFDARTVVRSLLDRAGL